MNELTEPQLRIIIREEISDSELIGSIAADVANLKVGFRSLEVKFEDFGHKMDAIAELVTTTVQTRNDTVTLKDRVEILETDMSIVKAAIKRRD
jgi:hypothetical protein